MVVGLNGVNGQTVVLHVGVELCHANGIVTIQRQSAAEDFARDLPKISNRVTLQRYVLVSICLLKKGILSAGISINISAIGESGYS